MSDLLDAKDENEALRDENERMRAQLIELQTAQQEATIQGGIATYIAGASFPEDFEPVVARIIGRPPSPYQQEITISAGSGDGIVDNAPVVTEEGLVGLVTDVAGSTARITLLTDQSSAVSAVVLESGAAGVRRDTAPAPSSLILDRVEKDQMVAEGNTVITSGWKTEQFESLFPRGISIGIVESVGQQDVDLFKRIQIAPLVDFDSLSMVIVLLEKPNQEQPRAEKRKLREAAGAVVAAVSGIDALKAADPPLLAAIVQVSLAEWIEVAEAHLDAPLADARLGRPPPRPYVRHRLRVPGRADHRHRLLRHPSESPRCS